MNIKKKIKSVKSKRSEAVPAANVERLSRELAALESSLVELRREFIERRQVESTLRRSQEDLREVVAEFEKRLSAEKPVVPDELRAELSAVRKLLSELSVDEARLTTLEDELSELSDLQRDTANECTELGDEVYHLTERLKEKEEQK